MPRALAEEPLVDVDVAGVTQDDGEVGAVGACVVVHGGAGAPLGG